MNTIVFISYGAAADTLNVEEGRICSVHFADDCFEGDLKNELLGLPIRRILKDDSSNEMFII